MPRQRPNAVRLFPAVWNVAFECVGPGVNAMWNPKKFLSHISSVSYFVIWVESRGVAENLKAEVLAGEAGFDSLVAFTITDLVEKDVALEVWLVGLVVILLP